MSQVFIVTISYSDGYDSDYNVKSITVPDSETVESVKELFLSATKTYDPYTSYNVYTLDEWLQMSSYDDWETVRNDITNRAEKHKKIRKLQENIQKMKNGEMNYYSDSQIEKWEREIEKLYETWSRKVITFASWNMGAFLLTSHCIFFYFFTVEKKRYV